MAPPVTHLEVEPREWGPTTNIPGYIRVAGRCDKRFQFSGPLAVLHCGVAGTDPANTIEVNVFSNTDREARVRVTITGAPPSTKGVSGASRTSDGARHWYPDRKFHEWRSGDTVNLRGKATLAIVVPWDNLFGHSFPREGEEFDVQCEMETRDGLQRAKGHFTVTEVTRFKKLELIGH